MTGLSLLGPDFSRRLGRSLARLVLVLWVGGLWSVGYLVVPVLFSRLPTMVAGELAGKLFALIAWIGIVAGGYLLVYGSRVFSAGPGRRWRMGLLFGLWGLAWAQLLWLQPLIAGIKAQSATAQALGSDFAFWHGVSSLLYLFQSLAGAVLVAMGLEERRSDRV